ncbi:MAG: hypothetical protein Q7T33_02690 [Dehalococcoidia bacterium]|nr:hypothetical protein [Dehalococcoidia bacterium]
MSSKPLETSKAARTSLPPARSYEVPGGPLAKDLGKVDVYKLAEIARGGEHDNVR